MATEFPQIEESQEDIIEYLDELRDSGATNMFGAGAYIEANFGMSRADAKAALLWWMEQC